MTRSLRVVARLSAVAAGGLALAAEAQKDCFGFIFLDPMGFSISTPDQSVRYLDPTDVVAEDLNGDGLPDLVVSTGPKLTQQGFGPGDVVSVLTQLPNDAFGAPVPIFETSGNPSGPSIRAVEVGDFNGDGLPDIAAVTNRFEVRDQNNDVIATAPAELLISINNGGGQFFSPLAIPAFFGNLTDLVVGHFNDDPYLDAAACAEFSGSANQDVVVFWGTPFGLPVDVKTYVGPDNSVSIFSADINGDDMLDLLVADRSGTGRIRLLINKGQTEFGTRTIDVGSSSPPGCRTISRVVAADINGDQQPDIIASSSCSDAVFAWMYVGNDINDDPVFGTRETLIETQGCDWIEVAGEGVDGNGPDLDDNGLSDLVVFNTDESEVRVYSGEVAGSFCLLDTLLLTAPQRGVIANIEGDASNDDDVDIVVVSDTPSFGTVVVVSNGGDRNCDAIDGDETPDDLQDFMGIATWNFAENGSFHDENVWCPIEIPDENKKILFKRDGMYTVELGRECGTPGCEQYRVQRFTVEAGMPSIEAFGASSPNLTIGDDRAEGQGGGDLSVGTLSGTPAVLEILSGELTVGFNLFERRDTVNIGVKPGTEGAIILDGPGARLDARAARVHIGTEGSGTLSLNRGFFEAGEVTLGQAGSDPQPRGRMIVRGNAFANIEAAINIFSGGELNAYDSASIFSSGTVSVLGGSITGSMNEGSNGITAGTNNRGLVSPGDADDPIGRLNFSSTYTQRDGNSETTGRLAIDVAGVGEGEHDVVNVNGLATLGGVLTVNATADLGALSVDTDPVRFLEASSISGQFDVALLPGLRDGRFFNLAYDRSVPGKQRAVLEVSSLGDEFGFDGTINPNLDAVGGPIAVGVAHMNDDGEPGPGDDFLDVVVVISGDPDAPQPVPGALLVLLNAGFETDGTWAGFSNAINRTLGMGPTALDIGDLDGDGTNDIAVTHRNEGADEIRIGLNSDNDGDVTFFPNQMFVNDPTAIVIADFNEDGGNDVAVVGVDSMGEGSLVVRLNTNTTVGNDWQGLDVTARAFPSGGGTTFMEVGDFDNDTCIDIFLTSDGDGGLNIFTNQGVAVNEDWNGFDDKAVIATGPRPAAAYAADLNLDSDPSADPAVNLDDIIVVDRELNQLTVLLNNNATPGILRFSPPAAIPFEPSPIAVTAGDYDGDGDPDVATIVLDGGMQSRSLLLLRNDLDIGTGQVQFAEDDLGVPQPANPVLLASGDVSLDENEDLIAITGHLQNPGMPRGGSPSELRPFFIVPQAAGCNPADLAEPFDVLDLEDISVFVTGFTSGDPVVDFDQNGVYDLADITVFVTGFEAGCP